MEESTNVDSKKVKTINPVLIILILIVIASIATYVIPAGQFERVPIPGTNYESIDPNSYKYVEQNPLGVFDLFVSFTRGLQAAGSIIFSLIIIGGAFKIVEDTGALHAGLGSMVKGLANKELLLVPLCILTFGLVSAFAGCWEEYLPFTPLIYTICLAMGFDSITAIAIVFCGAGAGYGGAITNVYTVGVAQGIAGLPMFSGMQFRMMILVALLVSTIIYVLIYAKKIKKNPEKGSMWEIDNHYRDKMSQQEVTELTGRQKGILAVFFGGFAVIAFCVIKFGFYIDEIGAIFLIIGIIAGIMGKMDFNQMHDSFFAGCKDFLWVGFVIGLCRSATIIMEDAKIFDTIIYAMGYVLNGLSTYTSAVVMFVFQSLFNFIVPSGSGQAAITMPFMAPLSDIIGLTRQTSVLAFQFGDSFTNLIAPTAAPIMAALAMCHVPYNKWFKFMAPLWGIWALIASAALCIAVYTGFGPF